MPNLNSSKQIRDILNPWSLSKEGADTLFGPTRDSLEEVSRLTMYLDEKAARVLTAVAFISALAATAYDVLHRNVLPSHPYWLNLFFNLLFYVYGTLVGLGAFCVITGIFPRLSMPVDWSPLGPWNSKSTKRDRQSALPGSFLFAPQIVKSSPREWAQSFVANDPHALKCAYVKDHIHEAYLVAEQISYKLGWLWAGMRAIQIANLILVAWFTLTGGETPLRKIAGPGLACAC
jgi:hypothetical protein